MDQKEGPAQTCEESGRRLVRLKESLRLPQPGERESKRNQGPRFTCSFSCSRPAAEAQAGHPGSRDDAGLGAQGDGMTFLGPDPLGGHLCSAGPHFFGSGTELSHLVVNETLGTWGAALSFPSNKS